MSLYRNVGFSSLHVKGKDMILRGKGTAWWEQRVTSAKEHPLLPPPLPSRP